MDASGVLRLTNGWGGFTSDEKVVIEMAEEQPLHGSREPTDLTAPRASGSIRRTTTMDGSYPEGLDGPLILVGRGRDLLTSLSGGSTILAEAGIRLHIGFAAGPSISSIDVYPGVPGVSALVGRTPSRGFRGCIDETTSAVRGSLAYLLLDEIPVSTLVSGYALHVQGDTNTAGDVEPAASRSGVAVSGSLRRLPGRRGDHDESGARQPAAGLSGTRSARRRRPERSSELARDACTRDQWSPTTKTAGRDHR